MKNILRNILLGGLSVTMLASCNLDLVPSTAIKYEKGERLILSGQDVQEFLNGVIASYRGLHYGQFYQTVEVMSECFNATVDFGNNYGFVHRLGDDLLADDEYTTSIWASHYAAIKNYNFAIEQSLLVEDEALLASAELLRGMAYFCRASSYLALARAYSADYEPETAADALSVPLILKYDQYEKPVQSKLQDVYDQIIIDLDAAESILKKAAEAGSTIYSTKLAGQPMAMVPTIDAVKALKARYFLDIHEYADAADYALEVIKSEAGYVLSKTVDEMNTEFMLDAGKESIMRLYASQTEGLVGCTIYTGVASTEKEGKFFQPLFIPSKTIIDAYDNSDLRKQTWFPVDLYPVKMDGTLYKGIHMFTKYIGNSTLQEKKIEDGRHYCKPIMLAEMYLIAAEALAQDGSTAEAAQVLNELQTARKAKPTDGSLESVQKEWLRETVGDGQRISCIKRWGIGLPARPAQAAAQDIVMTTPVEDYTGRTLAADSHTLVWPVPSYEINIAPYLKQNPGYTEE